jgi:D-alanyl-D-alanine carboxypeptidase
MEISIEKKRKKEIDHIIHSIKQNKSIKHILIGIESIDGSFSYRHHSGIKNETGISIDVRTPFMIASVTKLFIASSILRLQEMNRLSIENLITDYFSSNLINGIHVYKGKMYHEQITIKHLLNHSSGINDYLEIKDENKTTILDRVIGGLEAPWSIEDVLNIVKTKPNASFVPQDMSNKRYKVKYSDTNFQLLITIIEKVTGLSIEDAFKELILEPLNLKNTFLPSVENEKQCYEAASLWIGQDAFNKPLALRSFGDLYSSIDDLIVFMKAYTKGGLFQKQETKDMIHNHFQTFGFMLSPISPGWPIQYSLGIMKFKLPRIFTWFRPLPEVIGHTGVGSAFLFYCPELDLIFTGTCGQVHLTALPFQLIPKLVRKLL